MSEGYFPNGELDTVDQSVKLQEAFDLYKNTREDDFPSQLKVIDQLLELLPYSASLMIVRGAVLEVLAKDSKDPLLLLARESYERAISIEPENSYAKLNLGLLLMDIATDLALSKKLLNEAADDFLECHVMAFDALAGF